MGDVQRRGRAKLTTFSTAWNPGLFPVRGAMRGSCDQRRANMRASPGPRAAALASVRSHQRCASSPRVLAPAAANVRRTVPRSRAASWRVEAVGAGTREEAGVSAAEGLSRMASQLAADGADGAARLKALVRRGKGLPALAEQLKTLDNRIVGCTTQVWLTAELDTAGHVTFKGASLRRSLPQPLHRRCLASLAPSAGSNEPS